MIFLQKVTVFLLAVLHWRCGVYGDDHWTMTMEAHPISSRLKSSFLCTSFIRDLRIFGRAPREGCPSTGRNGGWNMFGSYNFIFWLVDWMFDVIPHLFPHDFNETSENIQTFAKFFLVRFIEGEPLRNHFPTGWAKKSTLTEAARKCHQHLHKQRRGKSSLHCSGIYRSSKTWFFNIFFKTAWNTIIKYKFPVNFLSILLFHPAFYDP